MRESGKEPAVSRSLGERAWPELAGQVRTLLVPVGSCEQHGPHLPLDTDARVAVAVARRAAAGDPAVLVAPPVTFGASGEHEGFPGTVSIGHEALHVVLVEIGRSAGRWASRLVFVNGHGGNLPTVPAAAARLRREGRDVGWFGCGIADGDAHAGRTETALLLALAPDLVRSGAAEPGNTGALTELLPSLRAGGVAAVSPNGVLGDPTGATAEEGERMLAGMADRLRERLARWCPDAQAHLR